MVLQHGLCQTGFLAMRLILCYTFSGLEKSVKDLHRQTVSLERLKLVFNDEVEKAYKRIRSVFEEVRNWYVVILQRFWTDRSGQ